ncbi:uncharacterized protein LOC131251345 [Magnolia sinica]|uniref:uncharacterized protein LOC131251345 n=1 Tax=Magnolia sinica TaxID=86752 RepID=UPI002659B512|nr:uncharacterized protein LOC131251345 [Magnolia sinica]
MARKRDAFRDAFLGRGFKTSTFKTTVGLAISRLSVLKNQRQVRYSQARSDVAQLLQLGHHERALLRVEHVIKEQNMLDVFVLIEGYCNLLIERTVLIENQKDCPHELHEAIASVIFAASRCGESPELNEIRSVFTSRYGKDFAAAAVELRSNCRVNTKMIQKMSTRQPSLEIRLKVLKEIAAENGITLNLEEPSSEIAAVETESNHRSKPVKTTDVGGVAVKSRRDDNPLNSHELDQEEQSSGSIKERKKYADVASAAQAAFESAALAAAAARAAVELSRTESGDQGGSPGPVSRNRFERNQDDGSSRLRSGLGNNPNGTVISDEFDRVSARSSFDKVHPIQNSSSDSENEELPAKRVDILQQEIKGKSNEVGSTPAALEEAKIRSIQFDESDDDESHKNHEFNFNQESDISKETNRSSARSTGLPISRGRAGSGFQKTGPLNAVSDENEIIKLDYPPRKQSSIESKYDSIGFSNEHIDNVAYRANRRAATAYSESAEELRLQRLNVEKRPISVRTKRGF